VKVRLRPMAIFACVIWAFPGCVAGEKKHQLSEVAKGWCRTIRASQVIPVYPLTQDVRVGDLFVVQRPVESEAQIYEEEGFLPLGTHVGRLWPRFDDFYKGGISGVKPGSTPQDFWDSPGSPTSLPSSYSAQVQTQWGFAPRAAFPSYGFTIKQSGGLDAALPLQGVPIGLTLLGAQGATANVTLADAFTYGLDTDSLDKDVREWARLHRDALRRYSPLYELQPDGKHYQMRYNFLRVVSRVYLVARVNVSLVDTSQGSGSLSIRPPNTFSLFAPAKNADDYAEQLKAVNAGLATPIPQALGNVASATTKPVDEPADGPNRAADVQKESDGGATTKPASRPTTKPAREEEALPPAGGSIKVAAFSRRSVSLDETFPRPLVVGYIAFDLPIYEDGELGERPVSTQVRVRQRGAVSVRHRVHVWARTDPFAYEKLDHWMSRPENAAWLARHKTIPAKNPEKLLAWLARNYTFSVLGFNKPEEATLNRRLIADIIDRPYESQPNVQLPNDSRGAASQN
jgi:hypothetical protein